MYFIYDKTTSKPFYLDRAKGKIYGVTLTSLQVTVDFSQSADKAANEIDCIYTLDEIRRRCGIYTVETYNRRTNETTKVSSGTVTSTVSANSAE